MKGQSYGEAEDSFGLLLTKKVVREWRGQEEALMRLNQNNNLVTHTHTHVATWPDLEGWVTN